MFEDVEEYVQHAMKPLKRWINQNRFVEKLRQSSLDELDSIHVDLECDVLELLEIAQGAGEEDEIFDLIKKAEAAKQAYINIQDEVFNLKEQLKAAHQDLSDQRKRFAEELEMKDIQILEMQRDDMGAGSW